jgi:hypothetical protein
MNDSNALSGWAIVCTGGRTMIGRTHGFLDGLPARLEPVYDAQLGMTPDPRGSSVHRVVFIAPLFGMSVASVDIPAGALVVPCEALTLEERRQLAKGVEMAEQIVTATKAQAAGIVIAGAR